MRWWYEENGQSKGPVEDGELRRTVIQTLIGALIVGGALDVSIPTLKAAAIAAVSAGLAVVMGVMSSPIGRRGSASVVV